MIGIYIFLIGLLSLAHLNYINESAGFFETMKSTIDEVIKCINTKVSFAGGGVIGAFFISIFNIVQMEKEFIDIEDEESIMFVDVGSESTKIFFEKGGQFKFYRIISLGGNDITSVIERYYNVDRERAEEEKKRLELLFEDDNRTIEEMEVFKEVEDLIAELEDSIKISIDYYKAQENAPSIDRIFLTGGTTLLKGFKQIIEKTFELEVETIDIVRYFSQRLDEEDIEEYPVQRIAALIGNIITEVSLK